jgi:hypothetical protein
MGIQRVSLLRYAIEQNDDDKKYILVEETSVTIFRPGLSTYLYQVFFMITYLVEKQDYVNNKHECKQICKSD